MRIGLLALLWIGLSCFEAATAADPASVEFFEKKVRPLFDQHCQQCHGANKQKGGLRLDSREAVLKGGDSGPAVEPGHPDKSRLVQAVRYASETLRMPPKQKLSDDDIAVLAAWVKAGVVWPENGAIVRPAAPSTGFKATEKDRAFWAFRQIQLPAVLAVKDPEWARTPIDRFVLAELEKKGLRPAPMADKRALLRRVTFDLIGLPPTPEEVEGFLADESPGAYERVVDRLLASPAYGERWARHWLDVARYGEDQAHSFQPRLYANGFRYRDWVVKAFNTDVPYDRFVTEQVAGDLLDGPDRADRLAATGFFALGPIYYGRSTADEWDDRVDTLARGFLGLTVACARCHDHKFDPIPTRDYYSLAGVFASTDYKEHVLAPSGDLDDKATQEPTDRTKDKKAPRKPAVHSLKEGKPVNLKVHVRGNPATLGEEAPRRFLAILTGDDAPAFKDGSGRLELARVIASRDNPLTARVFVNRVWAHHFGRGIVATTDNFGALGERPTHPELLDYLAARFREGWSIKALHREILLSATYRMSSRADEESAKVDPDNRLLWRMNRRRLEVEPWRDAMLAVAGQLDRTMGGPPRDLASQENRRRTLYGRVSRHDLDPLLRLFDFPDPNLTSGPRAVTTVPLQQLFVLNSEFVARQAKGLAERVASGGVEERICRAFALAYGRSPREDELRLGMQFLAGAGTRSAWEQYAQVLLSANEFAFVD